MTGFVDRLRLDYIVNNGGTIAQAVSTQVWSGEAQVHVSIVNWVKGKELGKKKLFKQLGDDLDSPWEVAELDHISASLSGSFDVTRAATLRANVDSDTSDQGQTHGHEGFLLTLEEGERMLRIDSHYNEVVRPYITVDEVLRSVPPAPQRYVIDFHPRTIMEARAFAEPFARIQSLVLPTRKEKAQEEEDRNAEALAADPDGRVNRHHANFLKHWWLLSYPRASLIRKLSALQRYVACGQVTKRPVFVFISSSVNPNAALQVFTFNDDYSFGVLQSNAHWEWFTERCSTLTERFRYTSNTVYDSFPWPQSPTLRQVARVAEAAVSVRQLRVKIIREQQLSLREIYRTLDLPGESALKSAHERLDQAVRDAYGMGKRDSVLEFLFALNQKLAQREQAGTSVVGPGLPPCVSDPARFVTEDCFPLSD